MTEVKFASHQSDIRFGQGFYFVNLPVECVVKNNLYKY